MAQLTEGCFDSQENDRYPLGWPVGALLVRVPCSLELDFFVLKDEDFDTRQLIAAVAAWNRDLSSHFEEYESSPRDSMEGPVFVMYTSVRRT